MGAAEDPLVVEALVHLAGGGRRPTLRLCPGMFVGDVFAVPALAARTVPGGEGDRLVVEEERRPAVRDPELAVAAPELQRAGDPEVPGVEADDLPALVEDPTVPGPGAAQRRGDDLPRRRDSIALRLRERPRLIHPGPRLRHRAAPPPRSGADHAGRPAARSTPRAPPCDVVGVARSDG